MREIKHIYSYSVWETTSKLWMWQVYRDDLPVGENHLSIVTSETEAILEAKFDIAGYISMDKVAYRKDNAPRTVYP